MFVPLDVQEKVPFCVANVHNHRLVLAVVVFVKSDKLFALTISQLKSWSQVFVQEVLPITVKLASVTYLLLLESATSAVVRTTFHV